MTREGDASPNIDFHPELDTDTPEKNPARKNIQARSPGKNPAGARKKADFKISKGIICV
jgi:hypothetical protein